MTDSRSVAWRLPIRGQHCEVFLLDQYDDADSTAFIACLDLADLNKAARLTAIWKAVARIAQHPLS
jgi:hypothetical protein